MRVSIRVSSRRSRCRPRLASAKTTTPTSCSLNSYGFDVAGNRTGVSSGNCSSSTSKSFTYNNGSQLSNAGYVYDGLGRNTSIPAIHSPNNAGVISVGYRLNDQVASITQNGETTAYSFDGLGRRVTETTGSNVVTKHYTGTSDNPAWSTNNAGVTDIYVSSLGTGLNSTVTLDNGVKTLSLDVNDLRGNTVTRINVEAASTDSWVSFDEYGNRDAASTGKLVTYDSYGQYERATTSQGLILMGARLYNPVTNQFTSPDPVTGGNETTYTYPNDPINKTDFDGNWGWGDTLDLALTIASFIPATAVVAGVVRAGIIVYKAASLVAKADKIVAVARNLKQADEMWGRVKASKSVANLAGKIWTKSTKYQDIQKGRLTTKGLIGFRNGKPVQYRGPKTKAGKTSANLEQFAKVHGDYATQPRFNFHIQIERGFFK